MPIASLSPTPRQQFSDANGVPLAGGKLFSFIAGTSTPQATYTDSSEVSVNTNPIILDSAGECNLWLGALFYRMVLQDVNGVQIWDVDNISSNNLPFVVSSDFVEGTTSLSAVGHDTIGGDLTNHRLYMSNNAGTPDLIVGQNTSDILTNKTLTAPVINSPTIDAPTITGTGTISGNMTLSGKNLVTAKKMNNRRYADQFPGGTADVQINAAIADLPAGGGIVDCTGYGCTIQTIADTVKVGNLTGQTVTLMFDRSTSFQITIINGTKNAFELYASSAMVGFGGPQSQGAPLQSNIVLSPTAVVNSVISCFGSNTVSSFCSIEGLQLGGQSTATVNGAMLDVVNAIQLSDFRNVGIANFPSIGLRIINSIPNGGVEPVNFYNFAVDGSANAGARPIVITDLGATAGIMAAINFFGGSLTHPGNAGSVKGIVEISNSSSNNIQQVSFFGTQIESSRVTDVGFYISGAAGVTIRDCTATASPLAGAAVVQLQNGSGLLQNILIENLTNFNTWTHTIVDSVNGKNIDDARINHYVWLNQSPASTINNYSVWGPNGQVFGVSNTAFNTILPLTIGTTGTPLTLDKVYNPSLTPGPVAAATVAEQTFTVTGLTTADKVVLNVPAIATAVGIAGARVSAADTLAIRFVNPTAGSLTPTAGVYPIIAFRS